MTTIWPRHCGLTGDGSSSARRLLPILLLRVFQSDYVLIQFRWGLWWDLVDLTEHASPMQSSCKQLCLSS